MSSRAAQWGYYGLDTEPRSFRSPGLFFGDRRRRPIKLGSPVLGQVDQIRHDCRRMLAWRLAPPLREAG
jgi:hypothetical protein